MILSHLPGVAYNQTTYNIQLVSDIQSCVGNTVNKTKSGQSPLIINGLKSGVKYQTTMTVTLTDVTGAYPPRSHTFNSIDVYTKPSQLGKLLELSTFGVPPTLRFHPPDGYATYELIVKQGQNTVADVDAVDVPVFTINSLQHYTAYSYSITATNTIGEAARVKYGKFTTTGAVPGPVDNMISVGDPGDEHFSVQWKTPQNPRGDLGGYIILVKLKNSCLQQWRVKCQGCYQYRDCPEMQEFKKYQHSVLHTEIQPRRNQFTITIEKLHPYRTYTVIVLAVNKIDRGAISTIDVLTAEAAATKVSSFSANDVREDDDTKVNVRVTWTPGDIMGRTTYTVIVKEKHSLNSLTFTQIFKETEIGETITEKLIKGFVGNWDYQIFIVAATRVGSATKVYSYKTKSIRPGKVTELRTVKGLVAASFDILFSCPLEKQRNGLMDKAIILRTNNKTKEQLNKTVDIRNCYKATKHTDTVYVGVDRNVYIYKPQNS